ncbi:dolichyl-phosphate-mannose-protein mannosyltransferase [Oryzihumus leptocrescens]|uniref:Dolichyl-phosphate-mannose-protein mannosyltransferase n=1 Tax=Oryzihumus leptocrescens TaxID=297536 RepID=A0A542ZG59_9MICO|nr:dolichyl-phosphate-mannose-protein mannosyltransferase [Oryzihumus leptocrescens]
MYSGRGTTAWRGLALLSVAFAVVLLAGSVGYGYHRDELYFLAIGAHPAWGYVDQPPLVPLLAHAMDALPGHSLVWLRLPSALAGGLTVLVTGLTAREFQAPRAAQMVAAGSMAASAVLVAVSHLASTSTFDLLAWTTVTWLVVRALRDDGRAWLLVGLAAGTSLEIKTLPVFLLLALLVGVVTAGPRRVLTSRWLWAGVGIALVLWAPNLAWQATHGWPQLTLSTLIASGHSGTSQPRWLFLPYQVLLISPVLTPVWAAGLWRLGRDPRLARWRCLAIAYAVLVVMFVATGGKPYYLCGMYPALLAAGGEPTVAWVHRGATRARASRLRWALALSAAVSVVLMLPVTPLAALHETPVVAINYDAGETVGWPRFAATVGRVHDALPARQRQRTIFLGGNYGEAGAVLHYRPDVATYSGHNSLWDLGPPPAGADTAVVVGYPEADLRRWFTDVRRVTTIDDGVDLENDEQGQPVWLCASPTRPWATLWPQLRRLG